MKTTHFWFAVMQFVGLNCAKICNIQWLCYWCAFWTMYEVIAYLRYKED